MGGIDWAGLPYVVAFLGIRDPHLFIAQMLTFKTHEPPKSAQE